MHEAIRERAPRRRPPAARRRRPARRLPLRRDRLLGGGRGDGGRVLGAGEDLLDRLRRRALRRAARAPARSPSASAPSTTSWSSSPTRSSCCRRWSATTASRSPTHSALPTFYLAELAREHVTVALNGDGGDEASPATTRYSAKLLAARLDRLPAGLRNPLAAAGRRADPPASGGSPLQKALRFATRIGGEREGRYLEQVSLFDRDARRSLYGPALASVARGYEPERALLDPWREASGSDLLDQLLEVDTSVYLPGDLLTKIDIATMAYSLEGRSPLLDQEFMELAASLPSEQKARGGQRKIALRGALRGRVPDAILDGRKQGFELPVAGWLRADLQPYAREVLLDPAAAERGWLDPVAVERLLDQHRSGAEDHGKRLWTLLNLELWGRFAAEPTGAPLAAAAA